MLSHETKNRLSAVLLSISEGERQVEIIRQLLCEQTDFEPYAAFRRIDRLRRGFLTPTDIKNFLADNAIYHSEKACYSYVRRYSGKEGDNVSYSEFLLSVLPMDNPTMRTMTTQRPNYDVAYDEYLSHDVEYSLSKLIDREIAFYANTDYQKYTLASRHDYSHLEAFTCIDKFNSGRIDYDNLKSFFRDLAIFPYDEEIIAILRRVDKDDDGLIKYNEFVEGLSPMDIELKHEILTKKELSRTASPSRSYSSPNQNMASPARRIATPSKQTANMTPSRRVASPERERERSRIELNESQPIRANLSPMRRAASPGRTYVYSPAKRSSPSPAQFRNQSPIREKGSEEKYADKLIRSLSKEKRGYTPSTAEKTTPVKLASGAKPDLGLSASRGVGVRKVLDYGKEEFPVLADTLIYTLKQFIVLDKDLEVAKQDLALRPDFNLLDFFRIFDLDGKATISSSELDDGFKKFGVFPNKDELFLFIRRYDRDNDGKIRFSDFTDIFTPKQNEYSNLLNNRTPLNGDFEPDVTQLFSVETRKHISRVLRLHLENEGSSESLRQKLNKKGAFNVHDAFNLLDLNEDGHITPDEMRMSLDNHGAFVTEKELKLLMERLDTNKDGRISYSEFVQEITPKSDKKFF